MVNGFPGWRVSVEFEPPSGAELLSPEDGRIRRLLTYLRSTYDGGLAMQGRYWTADIRVGNDPVIQTAVQAAEAGRRYVFAAIESVGLPEWPVVRIEAAREDAHMKGAGDRLPELLGQKEVSQRLGISRQRLYDLRQSGRFPQPYAELGAGPIWTAPMIEGFLAEWNRQPGRPSKS
jgi:hypothetical protein